MKMPLLPGGNGRAAGPRPADWWQLLNPAADPLPIERRHVQVGSACIYYQVVGAGEPLVLIHGLSGSGRWWTRNVSPLAQQFRVHIVDLIGFGGSRDGHRFVLNEAAAHLTQWLDQLGIERTSLIGHSMGGFIAADLAADFPERVDRLVLVDAAALPFGRGHLHHAVGLAHGLRRLPVRFLPVLITDAWRAGPMTILHAARELVTTDISPKLAQIRAPTLVVWGEHDSVIPLELGRQLGERLPGARFTVIPRAGHNPMWDAPEAFNRVVVDFLAADAEAAQPAAASRPTPV